MQLKKVKSARLYYTPRVISLFILPILCISYFTIHKDFDKPVVEVISDIETWEPEFKAYSIENISKRKFTRIVFGGANQRNDSNLTLAHKLLKGIIEKKDSLNGINFHYTESCQYDYFIKSYDLVQIKNSFPIFQNSDIWVFYYERPKKYIGQSSENISNSGICGTQDDNARDLSDRENAKQNAIWIKTVKEFERKYYPIMLIFIVLLIILSFKNSKKIRHPMN